MKLDHNTAAASLTKKLAPWTRRRFLIRSAAGIAAGTAALNAACSPKVETPAHLPHLGGDFPVIDKLVRTLLPFETEPKLLGPDAVPVLQNINALFGELSPTVRSDLGKGLSLFNYAAIVVGFYGKTFVNLSSAQAVAYGRRWEQGNKTQQGLMFALKQIVFMSYWREPAAWAAIDYEGPVTRKYGILPLGNAPMPEAT